MQMLHTSLGKSKKRKPTAKQRELQAKWEAMIKKYEPKTRLAPQRQELRDTYSVGTPACRETPKHPSLPFTGGICALKPSPVYTGDKIKGIGTMHKSNAVPVFSDEEAKDIATMRRG